ncbi:hypothetical protein BD310DRAFT_953238 [Dichomitus squalens]|uniref:DUF6533 domain-containing protein n=1 Tax=Dichomitus squalens TaxID=114155 RepID=A0A4Q9P9Y9_9APHY|nr:hypothetical protein BD310DRAFT_953238 [Dichomitus squalens]
MTRDDYKQDAPDDLRSHGRQSPLHRAAILYFDYALTLGREVERFWKGRFALASFVFYLNRYLSLTGHIPVIYEFYWVDDQSVSILPMYHQMLAGVTQVIVGGLQLFRVRALYGGARSVTLFLFALCVVGCAISGWSISKTWTTPSLLKKSVPDLAVVWVTILVFDLAVFALTVCRIVRIRPKLRGSLFTVLLRDGESNLPFVPPYICADI